MATALAGPTHTHLRRAALPVLAAVMAIPAAPSLACSPPFSFDIALTMSVAVADGAATLPGSRGRIVFTAWRMPPYDAPGAFEVRQAPLDPTAPGWPPIRLAAAAGSDCTVVERQSNTDGQLRRFQVVEAPRDRDANWPRACAVDFEVLPGAVAGQALRYTAVPVDFCATDVRWGDNSADFVFGTIPPPAAPARPAPLAAWPLVLLVLAMLAVVRWLRPRSPGQPV